MLFFVSLGAQRPNEGDCLKMLSVYLKKYLKECILGPLFKLLEALFELFVPLVVASVVDRGIVAGDPGHVTRMCLLLVVLALIGLCCSITAQYFAARAAIGCSTGLRHALLEHIQQLSHKDLDRVGTSTLITRMTGDINQIQSGVNLGLRLLLRSPFIVFGSMIMAFTIDSHIAMIFVIVIAVLLVIVFGIMLLSMPMYKRVQGHLDGITSITRENLTGVRVIRAFCLEDAQNGRFHARNAELTGAQVSVGRLSALLNPLTYVVINLALILLIRGGALRVDAGILTQGQVIALYNYMGQILVELVKMANLIISLTKAGACGSRVSAILSMPCSQQDGALEPAAGQGAISFRDVSLNYQDSGDAALEHISFDIRPGQTVGIIGGTGSGKSSLVNLIPRFYDATAGEILVDGVNVNDYKMENLRSRVGMVPQKAVLFKGTVRGNLLWGNPDATEADLAEALETAQAAGIIADKPLGLDEPVEQDGKNFSGGQRQRLTIARALVRRPEILILDDSASALDFATDASLRQALRRARKDMTTVIVSQRTSSVRFADQILVLDDGELVGVGTHDELLATCPVYKEIYDSQFGGEEAENHG